MNYALTVAERLHQIKSLKRVTLLKYRIDGIVHEAVMEEMPDD